MSGIIGIINLDGAPVDRELLGRLTSLMSFRGPDAQEVWCGGHVGLGHAMLRATCSAGRESQPCTIDGQVWIAADARIDGRGELREALEAAGRRGVHDATDAELILHAYRAWGGDCVRRLVGDFAFAIWDARRRRLFCARDHLGVRPFYYADLGSTLVFGNTIDCLRLHPAVSGRLDELAVADLLLFGYPRDPSRTAFAGIVSLPPAHRLVADGGGVLATRYWELQPQPVRFRRAGEYAERFTELLDAAVADRLRQPRAAILMSGGLDSPSVAASAARRPPAGGTAPSLRAYTIVYDRLIPHDERHWAGVVARHLGIPIEFVPVDDYGLYQGWDGCGCGPAGTRPEGAGGSGCVSGNGGALRTPEPLDNPLWALPVELLRRIAADGHRVVLSGEGGDASCAPTHKLPELLAAGGLRPLLRDVLACWRRRGRRPPLGIGEWVRERRRKAALRLAAGAARSGCSARAEGGGRDGGSDGRRKAEGGGRGGGGFPGWLHPELVGRLQLRERWAQAKREDEGPEPPGGEACRELRSPFWPWCVLHQDAGWTRVPLEVRYPFLDLRLVEFLLGVPGVPWSHDKELLREAARARLPREVCERPKTPLSDDPVAELIRRSGPPTVEDAGGALWQFVDRDSFLRAWRADPTGPGWRREDVTRALSLGRWIGGLG